MTRCSSGGDGVLNLQASNDNCQKRCMSPTMQASSEFRSIYSCPLYINPLSMMPIDAALQYCRHHNIVFYDVFSHSSVPHAKMAIRYYNL